MKLIVFTSNAIRHKYFANNVIKNADDALIISECKPNDVILPEANINSLSPIEKHFYLRQEAEDKLFPGNDYFEGKVIPILHKEVNTSYIQKIVKQFNPDMAVVFGSSIIREPLLSLIPAGRFINLHLGLSPYYRGSGTNFWPFVNEELEYIGSTILHIDSGIDTGDILCHVVPGFEKDDNVHSIGCKVIQKSAEEITKVIEKVKKGETLNRVKQWQVNSEKYYKKKDFNEEVLEKYYSLLNDGLVERFLNNPKQIKMVANN